MHSITNLASCNRGCQYLSYLKNNSYDNFLNECEILEINIQLAKQ